MSSNFITMKTFLAKKGLREHLVSLKHKAGRLIALMEVATHRSSTPRVVSASGELQQLIYDRLGEIYKWIDDDFERAQDETRQLYDSINLAYLKVEKWFYEEGVDVNEYSVETERFFR